jgi:hypothetical protein
MLQSFSKNLLSSSDQWCQRPKFHTVFQERMMQKLICRGPLLYIHLQTKVQEILLRQDLNLLTKIFYILMVKIFITYSVLKSMQFIETHL